MSDLLDGDAPTPLVLRLNLPQEVTAQAPATPSCQAEPALGPVSTLEPDCPVAAVLLELKYGVLDAVEDDERLHRGGVRLQEVEIVMETTRVQRREDKVARLDHTEAESVVETPARMQEHIGDDLRHPKESKNSDSVKILSHYARTEHDERERDEEDDGEHV